MKSGQRQNLRNNMNTNKTEDYKDLDKFQEVAMSTCTDSSHNWSYMSTLLCSEVGELLGYIGKLVRKGFVEIDKDDIRWKTIDEKLIKEAEEHLMSEAGDILWALSGISEILGYKLSEVAKYNNKKLAERKAKGTIIDHKDH